MTAAPSPITTLDQAKAWLSGLPAGGAAAIGPGLFGPAIVQQVFQVIAHPGDFALSSIAVDLNAARLTGTATVLGETCVLTFSFEDVDDALILGLAVARPKSYRWQPLPAFTSLSLGNLVAQVTADPGAGAVTLAFGAILFADGTEFDALLTLPAVPGADWTLTVSENTSQPFSTELMTALSGGTQALSLLPASSFPLEHLTLSAFEIAFSPGAGKCSGLKLGLAFNPDPPWKPFGNHFAFTGFEFDFVGHFDGETSFQAVATAKTQIGPAHVDASVQFDVSGSSTDQAITVYLEPDTRLSVGDAFTAFGVTLPHNFPDIGLSVLSLGYYVSAQHVDFALAIDKPFEIAHGVELDKFHFNLGISYQGGITGHGELLAVFSIPVDARHGVSLELIGAYDSGGALSLSAKAGSLPAGDLIAALLKKFGIAASAIPAPIANLQITLIELDFTRTTGQSATDTFDFSCDATTTVAGATAGLKIRVTITYDEVKKAWSALFTGVLTLKPDANTSLEFDVVFSRAPADTWFLASFKSTRPLGFGDIAKVFGFELPPVPQGLNLDLMQITLRYDAPKGQASSLFVGAASANPNYGKVSYITQAGQAGAARQHVFVLAANRTLSLAQLPLVGPELAKIGEVALEKIQAAIAFPAPLAGTAANLLNTQIAAADPDSVFPRIPLAGLAQRILLAAELDVSGSSPRPVSIPLGGGGAPQLALIGLASADTGGTTSWFDVQKSIGPVSIQKIGLRYADSTIWGLMNASLEAGPVQLGLIGLGVGSPLDSLKPRFTVDGVTISVNAGPMGFSGALVGKIDPVDLYGELGLSLPSFSIGALGAYANYQGHPSCFLYAVLNAELGGPPFFFVTGLAAGFGLNRELVVPPVGSLGDFPLIAWAKGGGPNSTSGGDTGGKVQDAMQRLASSGVVAPSIGEYWLAAGIRFSSFQLIDSFALLVVKFGNEFEIDLLGLSSLSLPPDDIINPIALAELALEASFQPAHGLIAVSGQLTPRSFLLSRQCHLTGGFAFYMWYGKDHPGEFVLTLGGYSPRFNKPSHYPDVPRLGLNWQVTDQLSISGDEYFALTASAVMAGGGLRAVWSSGSIRAWFVVEADFLLLFKPLHYFISVSIELGASVHIDLWFTSFTITVHLGVDGEIWGPPFGGRVHVDLDIVSFTIGFGADEVVPQSIEWPDFVRQVLPSRQASAKPQALSGKADTAKPPVVQINGVTGILRTLPPVAGAAFPLDWLVDGDTIELAIASSIPVVTPVLQGSRNATLAADPHDTSTWETHIAVGPSDIAPGQFTSTLTVTADSPEDTTFFATRTIGAVPRALWNLRQLDAHGIPTGIDPLADTVIPDALTGLTIIPEVPAGQKTLPVDIQYLRYTEDGPRIPLPASDASVFTVDPFSGETVHATITQPVPAANRAAVIAAATRAGFGVGTSVDVSSLADPRSGSLLAQPALRYLVEAR